ncbi:MAG: hypothetical protein F4073_03205 [Rhodobacteraceae bacterium]|nr:hypothetical protein [Paracoccaceae bacterium]MYI90944.1 hypothetical protein [Paracoccaceae bacterium]
MKAKWCIQGFDSLNEIFKKEIPHHFLSENQLEELLKRLASRHLLEDEIISSSLNRRAKKDKTDHLRVNRDVSSVLTFSCGENPYYTATWLKCRSEQN